jgi:hypothetical protein
MNTALYPRTESTPWVDSQKGRLGRHYRDFSPNYFEYKLCSCRLKVLSCSSRDGVHLGPEKDTMLTRQFIKIYRINTGFDTPLFSLDRTFKHELQLENPIIAGISNVAVWTQKFTRKHNVTFDPPLLFGPWSKQFSIKDLAMAHY